MTVRDLLIRAREIIAHNPTLAARGGLEAEAEVLVARVLAEGLGMRRLLTRLEVSDRMNQEVPTQVATRVESLAKERALGRILQHLTGVQTFLAHEYQVSPAVLVPRPETELLVEAVLNDLSQGETGRELGIEIGLGSGAISIEILSAVPRLRMVATETSLAAISVARENADSILRREAERLEIIEVKDPLDVTHSLKSVMGTRTADFLVSNPPYLKNTQSEVEEDVARQEPPLALFAPEQAPLYYYEKIAQNAGSLLRNNGRVYVEIPHERSHAIADVFKACGFRVDLLPDLNGRERVLIARK